MKNEENFQMKTKTFLVTAALSAGLCFGMTTTNTQAASWHKGTPAALRGHWTSHKYWQYGYWNYNTSVISKHMLDSMIHAIGSSSDAIMPTIWRPKYRYLGNHLYTIKGMGLGGFKAHSWIKWQNHHSILIKPAPKTKALHYYR
jgi:hypothetical protein